MFTKEMALLVLNGVLETLYMTLVSSLIAYLLGLPMGVILVVTDSDGIRPQAAVNRILGGIINVLRSVPFIILLVAVIPITRVIVGTSIGSTATIVPLVIAAAPYVARVVEGSLREVDRGVIEAAQAMGASPLQIVMRVLLLEARPSLLSGAAVATTTILGYSAMAGIIGGGGLGAIAINYGYYRSQSDVMIVMIVILVLIVQVIAEIGSAISKRSDRRIR